MNEYVGVIKSGQKMYRLSFDRCFISNSLYGALAYTHSPRVFEMLITHSIVPTVNRIFCHKPHVIRRTLAERLPPYMVMAEVSSATRINEKDTSNHYSALVIVWFTDTLPSNLVAETAKQLEGVDWEEYAKDFSAD